MKQYRKQSENRIERTLEHMPEISDKRSKEEIYDNVKKRTDKRSFARRKRVKMKPVIASAAALFLIVLISTGNFTFNQASSPIPPSTADEAENDSGSQSSQKEPEEQAFVTKKEGNNDNSGLPTDEGDSIKRQKFQQDENDEKASIEKEPVVEISKQDSSDSEIINYTSPLAEEELKEGEQFITIPLLTKDHSMVVPLTFMISDSYAPLEAFQELNKKFSGEDVGLAEPAIQNIDWKFKGSDAELKAELRDSIASSDSMKSEIILQSMREVLPLIGRQMSNLDESVEPVVTVEGHGKLKSGDFEEKSYGFYIYTTEEEMSFLVSGNTADFQAHSSFEDTLRQMRKRRKNKGLQPPIPEEVTIEQVIKDGKLVRVIFSENSKLTDNTGGQAMIDAILLTAANFGFEKVIFEGVNEEKAGGYDLTKPLAIPVAPNYMAAATIGKHD